MGFIGRLDPSSDANSTSFYSNNTSVVSKNLNNSRYMMDRNLRENKLQGGPVVGKVMP